MIANIIINMIFNYRKSLIKIMIIFNYGKSVIKINNGEI